MILSEDGAGGEALEGVVEEVNSPVLTFEVGEKLRLSNLRAMRAVGHKVQQSTVFRVEGMHDGKNSKGEEMLGGSHVEISYEVGDGVRKVLLPSDGATLKNLTRVV